MAALSEQRQVALGECIQPVLQKQQASGSGRDPMSEERVARDREPLPIAHSTHMTIKLLGLVDLTRLSKTPIFDS